jgi:SAM-dependent methyltransferase
MVSIPTPPTTNPSPTPAASAVTPGNPWDARYAQEAFLFGKQPNSWLRSQIPLLTPGGRVLCVADGEGRNGVFLAAQGFQVEAFDYSTVAIAKARQLAQEHCVQLHLTQASCDDFAWPTGTVDAVVAIFVQFADPDMRTRLFQSLQNALAPGGWLLLLGYTPKQLEYGTGGPSSRENLYTEPLLREAFADLEIVELQSFEAELQEGSGHAGQSALIGLVARSQTAIPYTAP